MMGKPFFLKLLSPTFLFENKCNPVVSQNTSTVKNYCEVRVIFNFQKMPRHNALLLLTPHPKVFD